MLRRAYPLAVCATLLLPVLAAGCGRAGPAPVGTGPQRRLVRVVAAESQWGSIAAQIGGARARVVSVIADPATDPHGYQPTAADARAVAEADVVVFNGLGYDPWAGRLLAASPDPQRAVLEVGRALGLPEGANPHRWYFPADVRAVAHAVALAYQRADPADAGYFARRERWFQTVALAPYANLIAAIRARWGGAPVGYSESIFEGLGQALGLRLLTPGGFTRAVTEGTEVTAQDKRTVEKQVRGRQVRVWVFNSQNVTPDVERIDTLAAEAGIPRTTVTETLVPPGASFQQWQVAQLRALSSALARGAAR